MKIIIADATPLILLAKIALLDLLCERFSITTTSDVVYECTRRKELPDAQYIQKLIDDRHIRVLDVPQSEVSAFQKHWGLGKGESSVLILASDEKSIIMTDDYSAMRVARILRIPFITTLIIIIEMHRQGLLSIGLARDKISSLEQFAWFKQEIFDEAKRRLEGGS